MNQNQQNERLTVASLYFSLIPANPTFNNIDVYYKNRPVVSVRQGNAGSFYQVEVISNEGREILTAQWDEPVTVNVRQDYTGRVELDT